MINQLTTDFSTLPPIMAVDFDGTLVADEFPNFLRLVPSVSTCAQLSKSFKTKE